MQSIREIYKVGRGPSSSHTMGPERAALRFLAEHPEADRITVRLYGSLAKTGEGHGTDRVLVKTLSPVPTHIEWVPEPDFPLEHPNTLDFIAYKGEKQTGFLRALSVGGGDVRYTGEAAAEKADVYPESTFHAIAEYCKTHNLRLSDYAALREGEGIWDFLGEIWRVMNAACDEGLARRGVLPGGLGVERKAQYLFQQKHIDESPETRENRIVCAYAFAISEQNADGGIIVTAPTCGACSVLPSVLRYMQEQRGIAQERVLRALAVAGLIGDLIKTNASISGAECGCQAEIGSACAMAAAALGELFEMGVDQIEYAAEVALEHHLGLTCDPICGLVQIPCIERNAVAAMRAINAVRIANFLTATRKISFDTVVKTMYETGRDLSGRYRETAEGGLAKHYRHS